MKRILIFLICTGTMAAQEHATMYRVILKDKGTSPYATDRPEEFLSRKSIDRRTRQGFAVDETDLPLSPDYFNALRETGASVQTHSKWTKTIVVRVPDETVVAAIRALPFVADAYMVFDDEVLDSEIYQDAGETSGMTSTDHPFPVMDDSYWGDGTAQIRLNNGHLLHQAGYRGKNISIAVFDIGFFRADQIDYFDRERIKSAKNLSHETGNIFKHASHGTEVLSCMLSNKPYDMVGAAPEADYHLFKTEVMYNEYPVEEDYWVAALEYADSLGVDIVSSSVGYITDHAPAQLDGKTVPMSVAASMAASRGMIVCQAAGNFGVGNDEWTTIVFPADAGHILAVGATASDSVRSAASSPGYVNSGKVKPDLMAMGEDVTIVTSMSKRKSTGTSFSTPILAGLTACLWQALPELNSYELLDLLRKSGNRYLNPTAEYGYGIADFFKAYQEGIVNNEISLRPEAPESSPKLYPNPFDKEIKVDKPEKVSRMTIFTITGHFRKEIIPNGNSSISAGDIERGIYLIVTEDARGKRTVHRMIKK
jgi:subtilisin family serine protease